MSESVVDVHCTGEMTMLAATSEMISTMNDDQSLLKRYLESKDSSAFTGLVQKYIHFVHGVATRSLGGDRSLADDVTQSVFIIFSQKASQIRSSGMIGSWLHQTTLYACANARKQRARREHHEHLASIAKTETDMPEPNETQLSPFLDQAIASLSATDRAAVIGRYFHGSSTEQIAQSLNSTPEAIQKRLERAIEKLRGFFNKNKLDASTTGVSAMLSIASSHAAPDALTSTIVTSVFTSAAAGSTVAAITKGTLSMMTWIKIKLVSMISICTIITGSIGIAIAQQSADQSQPPTTSSSNQSIIGKWDAIDLIKEGDLPSSKQVTSPFVVIDDTTIQVEAGKNDKVTYKLNPSTDPKQMELTDLAGKKFHGIYDLSDDILRIAFNKSGGDRPANFDMQFGNPSITYMELKRHVPPSLSDDLKSMQGDWLVSFASKNGNPAPQKQLEQTTFNITDNIMQAQVDGAPRETSNIELIPNTDPKQFNIRDRDNPDRLIPGIYEIRGDTLKLYFDDRTKLRPTQMPNDLTVAPAKGSLMVMKKKQQIASADQRMAAITRMRMISRAIVVYHNKTQMMPSQKAELMTDIGIEKDYIYLADETIKLQGIRNHSETILIYDQALKDKDGIAAGFVDGHAEWIKTEDFEARLKTSIENIEAGRMK